eukprot:3862531-Prymnesium_polylepis.2
MLALCVAVDRILSEISGIESASIRAGALLSQMPPTPPSCGAQPHSPLAALEKRSWTARKPSKGFRLCGAPCGAPCDAEAEPCGGSCCGAVMACECRESTVAFAMAETAFTLPFRTIAMPALKRWLGSRQLHSSVRALSDSFSSASLSSGSLSDCALRSRSDSSPACLSVASPREARRGIIVDGTIRHDMMRLDM